MSLTIIVLPFRPITMRHCAVLPREPQIANIQSFGNTFSHNRLSFWFLLKCDSITKHIHFGKNFERPCWIRDSF